MQNLEPVKEKQDFLLNNNLHCSVGKSLSPVTSQEVKRAQGSEYPAGQFFYKLGLIISLAISILFLTYIMARAEEVNLGKVSPHFYYKEYACKCCGATKINIELILALEKLRVRAGRPVVITSGYRCPQHNIEVGGAKFSQHVLGNAVDIKVSGLTPAQVAQLAKQCGFTWTKVYATWTHCDVRSTNNERSR